MANKNKLRNQLKENQIDLCADISEQPIHFANWLHSVKLENMNLVLELTPEVLVKIQDTIGQQKKCLRLKVLDWTELENTIITI